MLVLLTSAVILLTAMLGARLWPTAVNTCSGLVGLQVQVLRDRCIWHPTYSALPLRRALLHTLAVGECCAALRCHWLERSVVCEPAEGGVCSHAQFWGRTILTHPPPFLQQQRAPAATARWARSCPTSSPTALSLTRYGTGALPGAGCCRRYSGQCKSPSACDAASSVSYCDVLQVLADLAEYRPPTAATTGQYSLKPERWREFDPFYPHYTP